MVLEITPFEFMNNTYIIYLWFMAPATVMDDTAVKNQVFVIYYFKY